MFLNVKMLALSVSMMRYLDDVISGPFSMRSVVSIFSLCEKYHSTICPEVWFLSQCNCLKQPVFTCISFGVTVTGATTVLLVAVVAEVVVAFVDDVAVDRVEIVV